MFNCLADNITQVCREDTVIIMTKEANVIGSDNDLSFEYIGSCHHEEADTSLYPHACHVVASDHKQFVVKATGTDVFVIAIHVCQSLTDVFLAKL